MVEKRLAELRLEQLSQRDFHPSPHAWEDQVLYFLMLDRFSDGRETGYRDNRGQVVRSGETPSFEPGDAGNAVGSPADAARWRESGRRWVGGNLKGLTDKIGYLKRLGVTGLWISPVFKQVAFQESYHGYGIQNFLDVDPHFGTREDLRRMVETAHDHGIYVILDIILNHSGDVFGYHPEYTFWYGGEYPVRGFRDRQGQPVIPFEPVDLDSYPDAWPDGAIWPAEFQHANVFTRKGQIRNWDYDPEYLEGDFFGLKDIHQGSGSADDYVPSPALRALSECFKFWIAYADIDGFRVDTVKHMDFGASRYFTSVIHEFTESIGKENFYLIGEITGGRKRAFETLEQTGLDAALGINDIPDRLEYLVKGYRNPNEYFSLFRNSLLVQKESHVWFKNKVVTMFDDHDQVRKGNNKARFCADANGSALVLSALALNATTLGIPCIYYGTEQCFNGNGGDDRYLRESMFGGAFGAFGSRDRHFFDESHQVYQELSKILKIRKQRIALRRGRQYLRPISGDGVRFGLPQVIGNQMRSVVPWSRIFNDKEVLLAINTDHVHPRTAWVTIDNDLHQAGGRLTCTYSTAEGQIGTELEVEARNGKSVSLTVPAAGFVMYE